MLKLSNRSLNKIITLVVVLAIVLSATNFACGIDISTLGTSSYNAKIKVNNDNTYEYSETIVVNCATLDVASDAILEFERTIDPSYKGRVSKLFVKGYDYEFNNDTNVLSITVDEIGSNSILVFEINYVLTGEDYMGHGKDELFLPMISDNWDSGIAKLNATISYPEEMDFEASSLDEGWSIDSSNHKLKYSAKDIPSNTEVAFREELPVGYWANATNLGVYKDWSMIILVAGALLLIALKIIFGKKKDIVISEERYAPRELSPAHVGYLVDRVVDNPDITALFFYLAEHGYMRINEYERKRFSFTYLKYPKGENKSTRRLFDALFDKCSAGDTVKLVDRADAIQGIDRKLRWGIPKDLFGGYRFFYSGSSRLATLLICGAYLFVCAALPFLNFMFISESGGETATGAILSVVVAGIMGIIMERLSSAYFRMRRRMIKNGKQSLALAIAAYIAASALFIYYFRFGFNGRIGDTNIMTMEAVFLVIAPFMIIGMRTRSKKNNYYIGKIQGLQKFMNECSKDDIKKQCEIDGNYYFKLMPYALAFNISRKFAGKFEYVRVVGPDWYRPYGVEGEYEFDNRIMNSMIVGLQTELNTLVFRPMESTGLSVAR